MRASIKTVCILLGLSMLMGCNQTEESDITSPGAASSVAEAAMSEVESASAKDSEVLETIKIIEIATKQETTEQETTEIETTTEAETTANTVVSASVPKIYINTKNGSGLSLEKVQGYVDADISIIYPDGQMISERNTAKVKVRGNTTSLGKKKPYTIKFSEEQDVCGMGAAKKWTLLAEMYDPSLMRNYLALHIAKELGLAYTSNAQYTEVWMDGRYMGVYLLTEPVEDGDTRVELKKKKGDFLIMLEISRKEEGVSYVKSKKGFRFKIVEPKQPTAEQKREIREVLNGFEDALKSHDYERIAEYADMDSFAAFALLNDYIMTVDIKVSSAYYYYKDGKLYAGPPWDFDLSMGNSNAGDLSKYDFSRMHTCYWFIDLYKTKDFILKMKEIFTSHKDYFKNIAADDGLIDGLLGDYQEYFEKNYSATGLTVKDSECDYNITPKPTFMGNVEFLKEWLNGRYNWFSTSFFK